ncbi:hybrid sensor histidine kinase/response regulator [Thermithiobacillus plumbiphilus]|uniref:histidine kinase n=1 Tax=Thermithiobacillus plumbiphilus TaxID=1729899 RepID=A0ABU9DB26_9PROT
MTEPLKVLYLEDNPLDADLVQWTLSADGIANEITRVETRASYVEAMERGGYDIILADYTLPSFDGISALAIAREMWPNVPFIILSGAMGEEVAIETLKSGATDYVLKQRMSRLVPSVRRALQQSEERRQREALEEQLRLLEKSVEHLNDIVMITELASVEADGQPRVVFVNEACHRRTGYTPEELVGGPPLSFEGPETDRAVLERMARAMKKLKPVREELLCYTKDGKTFWQELDMSPMADAEGRVTHWVSIGRDITERKRAEETRLQLQEQLYHSQKMESIGLLAGGIAHDFNNLLTSILSSAELGRESLPEGHVAHEDLQTIIKAALRASGLTKELLAYAGNGKRMTEVININHLVTDMLAILRSQMPRSIIVRKALQSRMPPVEADPVQIQQVIMNLCLNASQAMPDGGMLSITTDMVTLTEEKTRKFRSYNPPEPGLYALFEVSDTGSGMDARTIKRIFEPFYSTKNQGRGLGLAAVLGIIKSHRGGIEVESTPGEGSTFTVYLPASDKPFPEEISRPTEMVHGPHTVMFVDDEEILRSLGQRILERLGYQVILAADGVEAVRIFGERASEIDLVIMDLSMPRMGGEDAYREISRIRPDVKVILCSGYDESTAVGKLGSDNLVGLIQKPFEMKTFSQAVHAALERP